MNKKFSEELSKVYEEYEKMRTEVKKFQDIVKELKNEMMETVKDSGLDYVLVSGIDSDLVRISIETVEREVVNKKMVAEKLNLKLKDLEKIEDWVRLTVEGVITNEIIEQSKEILENELLSIKKYEEEEDD